VLIVKQSVAPEKPAGPSPEPAVPSIDDTIGLHAAVLSDQLRSISEALFPPTASKFLRKFSSGEAARLIGVTDSRLRQLSLAGEGPQPEVTPNGQRRYSLGEINALRQLLARSARNRKDAIDYLPHREPGNHLQVIAVTNFKGGSGKTTTAAHLAQYLALRGYRVLGIDLDPQASFTALLGLTPEFEVGPNETLYAAIRYDAARRPLSDIIRPTYFDGLSLVPGNLELMEFEHETPRALAAGMRSADQVFFARVAQALDPVSDRFDVVVIDCPPQLGYLTLSGICASTGVLVTVHPQMLDIASMSQFLLMTRDLLAVVREAGAKLDYDFLRYLVTRYEPQDGPQTKVVALLRNLFGDHVLTNPMVKSTAMSDAGLTKQTLYEIGRENLTRATYDRAAEALEAVHLEIENLIRTAWGREPRSRGMD